MPRDHPPQPEVSKISPGEHHGLMGMNELVEVYESTRRRSRAAPTWRLRLVARRVRRSIQQDRTDEADQVRLVAIEHELVTRGVCATRTLPVRAYAQRRPAKP